MILFHVLDDEIVEMIDIGKLGEQGVGFGRISSIDESCLLTSSYEVGVVTSAVG